MNSSGIESGFELCRELGIIQDWEFDGISNRYVLIKRTYEKDTFIANETKGYIIKELVNSFHTSTELITAVKLLFPEETPSKNKLNKLLYILEELFNKPNIDELVKYPELVGVNMGWIKIRLQHLENGGKLTKEDMLEANSLWKEYK